MVTRRLTAEHGAPDRHTLEGNFAHTTGMDGHDPIGEREQLVQVGAVDDDRGTPRARFAEPC